VRKAPLLACACVATAALLVGAAGEAAAQRTSYRPPLLNYFGPNLSHANVFEIALDYGGGGWLDYPQISEKTDAIPMLKIYLTLPVGVSITKSKVFLSPTNGTGYFYKYLRPGSPSLNPKPLSATTWLWTFRGLRNAPIATWGFWLDWGTDTGHCLRAVAHPMYWAKVKTNGRTRRVLKPIPHAPVETGYADSADPNGTSYCS
jgi:hypothetical protein